MYQFFVEENQVQNDRIVVIGEDVNHIVNVLRMKPGEKVLVMWKNSRRMKCG